jgi:hypothetical protein
MKIEELEKIVTQSVTYEEYNGLIEFIPSTVIEAVKTLPCRTKDALDIIHYATTKLLIVANEKLAREVSEGRWVAEEEVDPEALRASSYQLPIASKIMINKALNEINGKNPK